MKAALIKKAPGYWQSEDGTISIHLSEASGVSSKHDNKYTVFVKCAGEEHARMYSKGTLKAALHWARVSQSRVARFLSEEA